MGNIYRLAWQTLTPAWWRTSVIRRRMKISLKYGLTTIFRTNVCTLQSFISSIWVTNARNSLHMWELSDLDQCPSQRPSLFIKNTIFSFEKKKYFPRLFSCFWNLFIQRKNCNHKEDVLLNTPPHHHQNIGKNRCLRTFL